MRPGSFVRAADFRRRSARSHIIVTSRDTHPEPKATRLGPYHPTGVVEVNPIRPEDQPASVDNRKHKR